MRSIPSLVLALPLVMVVACDRSHRGTSYCDGTGCYHCDEHGTCQATETSGCSSGAQRLVDGGVPSDQPSEGDASSSDGGTRWRDGGSDPSPNSARCATDCDCPAGTKCSNGTCVAAGIAPSRLCQLNRECAGGECVNGYCHKPCASNTECGTGQTCQGGYCFDQSSSGCVYNADCPSGATCVNGTCHARCANDSDCSNAADFCEHGLCQPDWRRKAECASNTDCTGGKICVGGFCRTHCWTDPDCGSCLGEPICVNGYCTSDAELHPQCKLQGDCAPNQNCVNAACL